MVRYFFVKIERDFADNFSHFFSSEKSHFYTIFLAKKAIFFPVSTHELLK
jgi:hypothetical protein